MKCAPANLLTVLSSKLKVFSDKQGDKAKQMLAAIDANCGGKLAKLRDTPQDEDLMMSAYW